MLSDLNFEIDFKDLEHRLENGILRVTVAHGVGFPKRKCSIEVSRGNETRQTSVVKDPSKN